MPAPRLEHWNTADESLTEAAMRRTFEERGYRVSTYTYEPGTTFPPHTHGVDKLDGVLSGSFRIVLEGHEVLLGPGDMIFVPEGAVHEAAVVGNEPVVSIDGTRR